MKNKILLLIVFLFTFLWGIFFTYSLPFFWEDIIVNNNNSICPINIENPTKSQYSTMLLIDSAKEIIRPERLLQISFSFNYNDRPYAFTTYKLLEVFFGNDIVKFRIFKSIFFAINACLMFIIIGRVSRLFALLGTLVYTTSAELWVFLAYNVDIGLYKNVKNVIY